MERRASPYHSQVGSGEAAFGDGVQGLVGAGRTGAVDGERVHRAHLGREVLPRDDGVSCPGVALNDGAELKRQLLLQPKVSRLNIGGRRYSDPCSRS